jgi:hypothetical protein
MAFVPAYQFGSLGDIEAPVHQIHENTFSSHALIGMDDQTGTMYSAVASMCPDFGYAQNRKQLTFEILEVEEDVIPTDYNDGRQTKRFLLGEHRALALACVAIASRALVIEVQPEVIAMVTAQANMPKKALEKYVKLCKSIAPLGYDWGQVDSYHGSHMWIMEKK